MISRVPKRKIEKKQTPKKTKNTPAPPPTKKNKNKTKTKPYNNISVEQPRSKGKKGTSVPVFLRGKVQLTGYFHPLTAPSAACEVAGGEPTSCAAPAWLPRWALHPSSSPCSQH